MNTFLQDFLLLKSTNIDHVLRIVKDVSTPLLTITFVLGAIFENLGGQNFLGLFKRLIIALLLISFGSSLLKSSVALSFDISSRILTSAQKTNTVIQLIERAKKISHEAKTARRADGFIEKTKSAASSLWESTAFASKLLFDDGLSSVVFILSYAALLLLGQFYTLVYNFTYVSIPIIAALIVFPPTYSVANSISRTISWVVLMPIFTMVTILLLSMSFVFPQNGAQEFYFVSFENLINFCIMALMLLLVPTVLSGFLSGAGILTAAETFSKTTAMAAVAGGKGLVLSKVVPTAMRAFNGKDYGILTLGKVGINRGLDFIGNRSMEARKRVNSSTVGFNSTASSTTQSGVSSDSHTFASKNTQSRSESLDQSSSFSLKSSLVSSAIDRSFITGDRVLNFKKNHIASKAVRADMRQSGARLPRETQDSLFNKYKQTAHDDSRFYRPIDHKVAKMRGEVIKGKTATNWGERANESRKFKQNKIRGSRV